MKNIIIALLTSVLSMTLPIWDWIADNKLNVIIVGIAIFVIVIYITKQIDIICRRRARDRARRQEIERGEVNVYEN